MPLQETSGAASYDAFGGGVPVEPVYIEQVFATHLYTGTGSTQTINNGIDLAGKGGLVWIKNRSDVKNNILADSVRGPTNWLSSNLTNAQATDATRVSSFSASGFSVGSDSTVNLSTQNYASWTFREQPKFFDVVTWTGNGVAGRQISHALGSAPGCIMVKRTDSTGGWFVYHRSTGNNQYLTLHTTNAATSAYDAWFSYTPTATDFKVNNDGGLNASGGTYVAYIFAHNAGGFGLTGTDNVISCGSFTKDGSNNATVTLGYEPQWILVKSTNGSASVGDNWLLADNMRGANYTNTPYLYANGAGAEMTNGGPWFVPTATGFQINGLSGASNHIYIAIRRGPMRTPTSGTSVFAPALGRSANPNYLAGFPVDFGMSEYRVNGANWTSSRLQGSNGMDTASTSAESSDGSLAWDFMNGYYIGGRTTDFVSWMWRRAPGFFDVVCYRGVGFPVYEVTVNHNLGVVPELIITKYRNTTSGWFVYTPYNSSIGAGACIALNSSSASAAVAPGSINTVTSTAFNTQLPSDTSTAVAYLFASCPGVSKVGSYTGTGANLTVNCGFTGGARFVLIKRTDSTGNWFVWDTARGMVAGTDPRLALNTTDAESNANWVYTSTTGFQIVTTDASVNASGGSYIYLAIA